MTQNADKTGTGRRKCASARVRLRPGNGQIVVNHQPVEEYFGRATSVMLLRQPLVTAELADKIDVFVTVEGGGKTGQAGAVRHGIARALLVFDPALRLPLKRAGYLTRDSRMKERKKYGRRSARARFQFSKR